MKIQELVIREKIISLHKKSKSSREIAYLLDISKSKAAFWIKRFKDGDKIEDKQRSGRPTPLTKKNLDEIKKLLRAKLLETRIKKAGFSSKEVLALMENKAKRKYTIRHAERIMHNIGLSITTPRVNHIRKDEIAQDKFRDEFKKNSKNNIWVFQ